MADDEKTYGFADAKTDPTAAKIKKLMEDLIDKSDVEDIDVITAFFNVGVKGLVAHGHRREHIEGFMKMLLDNEFEVS